MNLRSIFWNQGQGSAWRSGSMARIESVDFFYLSMPHVEDIGDGSQDALVVRVRAGEWTGWGECEATPLASIAAYVGPMSHSACHPIADLGHRPADRQSRRHPRHRPPRGGAQPGRAAGAAHLLGHRDRALGSARAPAGTPVWACSATTRPIRSSPMPRGSSVTRRPRRSPRRARCARSATGREVRLGSDRHRRSQGRRRPGSTRRAGGWGRTAAAGRCGTVWVDDVERAVRAVPALIETRGVAGGAIVRVIDAYADLARRARPLRARRRRGRSTSTWPSK